MISTTGSSKSHSTADFAPVWSWPCRSPQRRQQQDQPRSVSKHTHLGAGKLTLFVIIVIAMMIAADSLVAASSFSSKWSPSSITMPSAGSRIRQPTLKTPEVKEEAMTTPHDMMVQPLLPSDDTLLKVRGGATNGSTSTNIVSLVADWVAVSKGRSWIVLFSSILVDTFSTALMKHARETSSAPFIMLSFLGYFCRYANISAHSIWWCRRCLVALSTICVKMTFSTFFYLSLSVSPLHFSCIVAA